MSTNDENVTEKTPPIPSAPTPPVEPSNADLGLGINQPKLLVDDDAFGEPEPIVSAEPVSEAVVEPGLSNPETVAATQVAPDPDVLDPANPADSGEAQDEDTAESEADSDEEIAHKDYPIDEKKIVIKADRPVFVRFGEEVKVSPSLFIAPTTTGDLETYSNVLESAQEKDLPWILAMTAAEMTATGSDTLIEAAVRKSASWSYFIERGNLAPLADRRDKFKSFTEAGQSISGSDAVEMFMAGTNLGRPVVIPLWHSGFWIKLRAPSSAYLAEIDRALAFSREELGLDVFGAIGSNDRLIFDEILVDAALKLVKESSLPFSKNPLELKEYISSFDIDSLIWGMAQAAFPDGCDIGIPCPSCRNVSNVQANLLRMRYVDESRLTEAQLKHMDRGFSKRVTLDELKEYQDQFEILNTDNWTYQSRNKFIFRIPTIEEYLMSGRNYLAAIGRALTETLREEFTDDNKRAKAMKSMLDAEEACRFMHYVKEVHIRNMPGQGSPEGYGVVSGIDEIAQILRQMSGDYDATTDFTEAVRAYIIDAINTIIGFPNVKCSKCGHYHLNTLGEETVVVPFNPAIGFFTLAQHKISASGTQPLTDLTTLGARDLLSRALVSGLPV